MIFDAYLLVDWSAESRPKTGPDSIWFCFKHPDEEPIVENPSTRITAYNMIRALLLQYSNLRILVGMDFPYGYPAGLAQRLGARNWRGLWNEWYNRISDDDSNLNNRFSFATDLNRRISGKAGPFWGCPESDSGDLLTKTKASLAGLPEYRLCEPEQAHSVWKLFYPGSVGSQALMGIPYLYRLRFDEQLRSDSCVWPFETGMNTPADDKRIVHAEIYPSLLQIKTGKGEIRDKAQVRELANWFHKTDTDSRLGDYFSGPKLTSDQYNQVKNHEGWILGMMEVRERPVENIQVQEPASPYQVEYTETQGKRTELILHAYHHRIETLRNDAEIEGLAVNNASEENFWSFIGLIPSARKAELVMMDNGNFRAVWKNKSGDHLGVQFLGEQMAEFVIFKHRSSAASVSRVAGIDTLEGVITQIQAFDLDLESLEAI